MIRWRVTDWLWFVAAAALAAMLCGCAVGYLRPDGGHASPFVSIGALQVDRNPSRAVAVKARSLGATTVPGFFSAGLSRLDLDLIPANACSLAIVHGPPSPQLRHAAAEGSRICQKGENHDP